MRKTFRTKKHGRVRRVIKPSHPGLPEKVQIEVDGADELYRDLHIENAMEDGNGNKAKLKEEMPVEVVIETSEERAVPAKRKQA